MLIDRLEGRIRRVRAPPRPVAAPDRREHHGIPADHAQPGGGHAPHRAVLGDRYLTQPNVAAESLSHLDQITI